MCTMKYLPAFLAVLLAAVDFSSGITVECPRDDEFTVTVDAADNLDDYYVRPQNAMSCTESVQLTGPPGDQSATITCFDYTVGVPFDVLFHRANNLASSTDDRVVQLTCNAQNSTVVTNFITVSLPTPSEEASGEIPINAQFSVNPATAFIGEAVVLTFRATGENSGDFIIGIDRLSVSSSSDDFFLIYDGCILDSQVNVQVTGNLTDTLVIQFDAFYYFGSSLIASPAILRIEGTVLFCHDEVGDDLCVIRTDCDDSSINPARRKRQAENAVTQQLEGSIVLFTTAEQKNAMVSQLLEEEGFSRQTKDQDDLCVNKTVSSVVLALLVVGMIICLLAAVWMFIKLRQARRFESKLSSKQSVFSHSNRGFTNDR